MFPVGFLAAAMLLDQMIFVILDNIMIIVYI